MIPFDKFCMKYDLLGIICCCSFFQYKSRNRERNKWCPIASQLNNHALWIVQSSYLLSPPVSWSIDLLNIFVPSWNFPSNNLDHFQSYIQCRIRFWVLFRLCCTCHRNISNSFGRFDRMFAFVDYQDWKCIRVQLLHHYCHQRSLRNVRLCDILCNILNYYLKVRNCRRCRKYGTEVFRFVGKSTSCIHHYHKWNIRQWIFRQLSSVVCLRSHLHNLEQSCR